MIIDYTGISILLENTKNSLNQSQMIIIHKEPISDFIFIFVGLLLFICLFLEICCLVGLIKNRKNI